MKLTAALLTICALSSCGQPDLGDFCLRASGHYLEHPSSVDALEANGEGPFLRGVATHNRMVAECAS
jgi:hypothetical protein